MLLSDHITNENLRRAEGILSKFFQDFCNLYPQGNCGLNIHNIGFHYVDYVQLLGPLWPWSCFPFEDCNSMITKSVHGTGNITHQVMTNCFEKQSSIDFKRKIMEMYQMYVEL